MIMIIIPYSFAKKGQTSFEGMQKVTIKKVFILELRMIGTYMLYTRADFFFAIRASAV